MGVGDWGILCALASKEDEGKSVGGAPLVSELEVDDGEMRARLAGRESSSWGVWSRETAITSDMVL